MLVSRRLFLTTSLFRPLGTARRGLALDNSPLGANENDWFRQQERAALDKLKEQKAADVKAGVTRESFEINEDDEKARLARILENVGVRHKIRAELSVQLLLWKHDEDLAIKYDKSD